jgi:hypothetical protein
MVPAEIVVQGCGCVAIPEEIASTLGMVPGAKLKLAIDVAARSITLMASAGSRVGKVPVLATCQIKS